jgi:hypothetical protein
MRQQKLEPSDMYRYPLLSSTIFTGLLALGLLGTSALAADVDYPSTAAVSAINGKVEFGGGYADDSDHSSDASFYGAASLSVPLGDMFGLQADIAAKNIFNDTAVGGNVHLFTRDPNTYLLGVIAGYGDAGKANAAWAGGEAEFYMGNISLEASAGYLNVNPDNGSSKDKLFAFGDVAFYPVENFRLALGASSVAGFESGHATAEYLLDAMPISLKLKGEVGENKFAAVTAGVSFYFGGDSSSKSLMRRHREDDPRNKVLDIFGAGAAAFGNGGGVAGVVTTPTVCPEGSVFNDASGECEFPT